MKNKNAIVIITELEFFIIYKFEGGGEQSKLK